MTQQQDKTSQSAITLWNLQCYTMSTVIGWDTCVRHGPVSSQVRVPPDVAGLQPTLYTAPLQHVELILSKSVWYKQIRY